MELLHIGCLLAWRRSPCGAGVGGGGEGVELEGGVGEGKGGGGGGTNHLPQVPVEGWLLAGICDATRSGTLALCSSAVYALRVRC